MVFKKSRPVFADTIVCAACIAPPKSILSFFDVLTNRIVIEIECHGMVHEFGISREKLLNGGRLEEMAQQKFNAAITVKAPEIVRKRDEISVRECLDRPQRKIDLE